MRKTIVFMMGLVLAACTADDSISRNYRCNFIFDTSLHPLPCQLTGILGNNGHFCKVEYRLVKGVTHLKTTRNYDSVTEDIELGTAKESQISFALGANNCIIIGTSSYDFSLVAYDGQCPNCLADYNGTNYPLTWQNSGQQLRCAKCGRSYDVNNGTIADGPAGQKGLLRYMAAYDGTVLRAWN
ncbi:MAG: hypothetical protein IKU49_00560 [Prevotella sp.]|nr:hypothetical protein [Prevotella sp.]